MKTVLFVWELGGGLGHVMRAAAFAREFHRVGLRVVVALSDLSDCSLVRWPDGVVILAGPLGRRQPQGFVNQSNYAELLYSSGYHDVNQISGVLAGWYHLFELVRPDVVVADHAPAAHLAARLCGLRHVRVGSGFFAPPPIAPTPRFRTWHAVDEQRALAVENRVLDGINSAMTACGAPTAATLGDALHPDLELIASWPELDCYAALRPPGSANYIGSESVGDEGVAPRWPEARRPGEKRIVAYLKADYAAIAAVLAGLAKDYFCAAYVSGMREDDRRRIQNGRLWIAPEPITLRAAANECDAFVCHAGAGSAPVFLEAGKPILMLPYSAEQQSNAMQIAATGAGVALTEECASTQFAQTLSELVGSPGPTGSAQRLAQQWSGKPDAVAEAVRRVLALLEDEWTS